MPSAVIVDTSRSPYAKLAPVPTTDVTITDPFWVRRRETNRDSTLPAQHAHLESTGRIDNFRQASGKIATPYRGREFNDSDVYKWIEGAVWDLGNQANPALQALVEAAIDEIEAAQQPDGYLGTYFMHERADKRWTLVDYHEMYCAGHLFQAAVAYHRTTGDTRLLGIATRLADHLDRLFGPEEEGKRVFADGHPEVEMALVELGRTTGERRYIDLANFFVGVRGRGLLKGNNSERWGDNYHQDHVPFREMDEITGHAVRAVYLNAGAADIATETGDASLLAACERIFANMTGKKMHASGGVGARHEGEAFGENYELPNATAYNETCAAIGSLMGFWRMFLATGEAGYPDLMEHLLFNAIICGVSLDGQHFFYENPLADDGRHRRSEWFHVACCPPNVARLLAQLSGYVYATEGDAITVNLYMESESRIALADGRTVGIAQETVFPWDGAVALRIDGTGEFALRLRVPAWAEGATLAVNGEDAGPALAPGTFAEIRREWQPGDTVHLDLPMQVRSIACHPYVTENRGHVAFLRGPLLYCVEQVDHEADVRLLRAPDPDSLDATWEPSLLGGVVTLTGEAEAETLGEGWNGTLYQTRTAAGERTDVEFTAVPYFTWANREAGPMRVWLPER